MFLNIVAVVERAAPDVLVVEAVQYQASPKSMLLLSQLQGMLIAVAYLGHIGVSSPLPVEWRKVLGYRQGPKVKREELKQQSLDFVKTKFNIEVSEDEAEAIAIACAHRLAYK